MDSAMLADAVNRISQFRLFDQPADLVIPDSPYRRPVRIQDLALLDISGSPLTRDDYSSARGLLVQRLLLNCYEIDLLFLPTKSSKGALDEFQAFYSPELRHVCDIVRPELERLAFDFLDSEISVSGNWNKASVLGYCENIIADLAKGESAVSKAIIGSDDPRAAAKFFLIQAGSDFLAEASAMARNAGGNYGPLQSDLFKVLVDEYGYAVHDVKHSTLFEETLKSVDLLSTVHAYWQFYLPTSLALCNYFHWICRDHRQFFRYLGALYFTEATLADVSRKQSAMLRQVFGSSVDTRYFDEHGHIDRHHGRMVREKLVSPVIDTYGDAVIPEILRGFEEFRLLQDLADADLIAQIEWSDQCIAEGGRLRDGHPALFQATDRKGAVVTVTEPHGTLSVPHMHDADELLVVEEGELSLITKFEKQVRLAPGDGILIRRGRLHGSIVQTDACRYSIYDVGAAA
jgi:mannose-6-phosphate isomerase-like protein (cupin superfamily)